MSANSKLGEQLLSLQKKQFTGILTIKSHDNKEWILYFYFGKLLWVKGGIHPNRSWQRHLAQFSPNLDSNLLASTINNKLELPKYCSLAEILQKKSFAAIK
jgi:chemotaxis family two-component system response regulator PixG